MHSSPVCRRTPNFDANDPLEREDPHRADMHHISINASTTGQDDASMSLAEMNRGATMSQCEEAGQPKSDKKPSEETVKDTAAAPECTDLVPTGPTMSTGAAGAAMGSESGGEQQEEDQSKEVRPCLLENLWDKLVIYRERFAALTAAEAAAAEEAHRLERASAEKEWDWKLKDLQKQLDEQTERADSQTARANELQAALLAAQAAAAASQLSANTQAATDDLPDVYIMLKAAGIARKSPALKQHLLWALGL